MMTMNVELREKIGQIFSPIAPKGVTHAIGLNGLETLEYKCYSAILDGPIGPIRYC